MREYVCRACGKKFPDRWYGSKRVYCSRECHKLNLSAQMTKVWQDHRGTMLESFERRSLNPNYIATRAKSGAASCEAQRLRYLADPILKALRYAKGSASLRMTMADPEFRAKRSRISIEVQKRPGMREKQSRIQRRIIREGKKRVVLPERNLIGKKELPILHAIQYLGLHCEHQYEVPGTRYTADIYIGSVKLIVEVDGHQSHLEAWRIKHDRRRDRKLRSLGYRVAHLDYRAIGNPDRCARRVLLFAKRLEKQ